MYKSCFRYTLEVSDDAKHLNICLGIGYRIANDQHFYRSTIFTDECISS